MVLISTSVYGPNDRAGVCENSSIIELSVWSALLRSQPCFLVTVQSGCIEPCVLTHLQLQKSPDPAMIPVSMNNA
uniref:Uncharacterized protein n=1 Tax=Knipowitschia caucasica TaxID=637954 RepID=A0AAV2LHI0_KNICA